MKGYALDEGGLWLGHWWCVDSQDHVIDPTWKNSGLAYVGIEVVDVAEYAKRMLDESAWVLEVTQVAVPDLAEELERVGLAH